MKGSLRIGILGTRGIPNAYGGFEQCAQFLSEALAKRGHSVTVYNSKSHPYQQRSWRGVDIVHCFDPEGVIGTAGQFIYDLHCIIDARSRHFDVVIQLGYTSSSLWTFLWPSNSKHLVNMDGLEYLRSKYSAPVRRFLRMAEKMAVAGADVLIADNQGISDYLRKKYPAKAMYTIAYGVSFDADLPSEEALPPELAIERHKYDLVICRMEPENNVESILEAHRQGNTGRKLVIVGSLENRFGKRMYHRYGGNKNLLFAGGIYDLNILNALRAHCYYYLHGHSVGGTNPSLLEAMAYAPCIIAHDNPFNRSVLGESSLYFSGIDELVQSLQAKRGDDERRQLLASHRRVLGEEYTWESVVEAYEKACYDLV